MTEQANSTIDFLKTTQTGFSFHKQNVGMDSENYQETFNNNYPSPSRNIAYFKGILNYSRHTMSSFHPISRNKGKEEVKRMHTETAYLPLMLEKPKIPLSARKETLITQPKGTALVTSTYKQAPSLYDLDKYYDQFETPKHKNAGSEHKTLSQTQTVLNTEAYSSQRLKRVRRVSTRALLNENRKPDMTSPIRKDKPLVKADTLFSISKTVIRDYKEAKEIRKRTKSDLVPKATSFSFNPMKAALEIQPVVHHTLLPPDKLQPAPNLNLKLPESLGTIRHRLRTQTNHLAERSRKSKYEDNIRLAFEKTKNSGYTKNIIDQIKLINNFISNQSEDKFRSDKLRHRKIYVIPDGQVIFSGKSIKGAFIEIPTTRYLNFISTTKERLEKYYEFLAKCQEVFKSSLPFKNIFLLNGINIFELSEIPPKDKAVYISMSNIFRGVHLFNQKRTCMKDTDINLLQLKEEREDKRSKRRKTTRLFMKKRKTIVEPKVSNRVYKTVKKVRKLLIESSFTFGVEVEAIEKEEYVYYSDNEGRMKHKAKKVQEQFPTVIDHLLYFDEEDKEKRIKEIKRQNIERLRRKLASRPEEDTEKGLDKLINIYNSDRGKRYNINMTHQMKQMDEKDTQENALNEDTKGMGIHLLKKLSIFKEYKVQDIILNEDEFYKSDVANKETAISKNIQLTYDVTPLADKKIQQYLPDLVSLNLPRVLKLFPKLKRKELYDIFNEFKTLLMFCVCINKNLKVMKKGIDFDTFFNCNRQIKSQGADIAEKIFKTINNLDSQFINWEQYMKGMLKIKSKDITEKIDLFFKVIDTDGNGMLSFDEVYDLSVKSLGRSIGECDKNDEIVEMLAMYFANLIFQLVELPTDEEIPIDLIREKIIEGKSAAGYLEMFICADNFTD